MLARLADISAISYSNLKLVMVGAPESVCVCVRAGGATTFL